VAHDFNNLLSVIGGYTEIALETVPETEELHADLLEIRRAVERAANLTRQLLTFSRRQVLSPVYLSVNAIILEAEKMLRRLVGEDTRLRLELAPQLGTVLADPGQIEQILMNLIINARDAMPTGGTITIATRHTILEAPPEDQRFTAQAGAFVCIAITDTGSGMDTAVRDKLFEPFFTTKEKGKGTGLGLAVVYGIVKQNDGWIRVISDAGTGTTMEIYLPEQHGSETPAVEAPKVLPGHKGHESILLVEDEPELRKLVQRCLERAGFRVLCAGDAKAALATFEQEQTTGNIDLLLTDVIMPGESGAALAETLQHRQPALKVLYMSGYTDDALAHHGLLDPGVALLSKPFSSVQLLGRVREVLDAPPKTVDGSHPN